MALSDADHLEALKIARDAIVAGLANGRLTVDYMLRGKRHTVQPSTEALGRLEEQIDIYERKQRRGTRGVFRVASLQRARGRDG